MSRICFALTIALLTCLATASAATDSLRFTDSSGVIWQRWIMTEPQNERTLLLVVEKPVEELGVVSQRVVYRHSFAHGSRQLNEQVAAFKSLRDRMQTTSDEVSKEELASSPHQPIWLIKQDHWALQDERNYTAWIQNTVTETFLQGSDIHVDCADLSLTLRWVYAHDHGLPAANTLSGAGGLFGHWSGTAAWDKLTTNPDWRKDARFKAALRYLLNSAYTHTLLGDLYPTEISREYVTPGAVRLTLTDLESGHTQVIHHVGHDQKLCPDGQCVSVFYGDTPSSETIYDDVAWLLNLPQGKGGFLRWRWPVRTNDKWSLTPASSMAGYSLEQFSRPGDTTAQYETYINTQLFWSTTLTDRATTIGYSLIQSLRARLQVTALGEVFCALQKCATTSSAYDAYATLVRDQRYLATRARFIDLITNDAVDTGAQEYQAFLEQANQPLFAGGGLTYANYIFDSGGVNEKLSPDPRRSFGERWGLGSTTLAQTQWAYESLLETLWTYRESQVQAAQRLCYANDPATLSCQATDSSVKSLATNLVDLALRSLRLKLRSQLAQLDGSTKTSVLAYTSGQTTAESRQAFCAQTPSGKCMISDFVYSDLLAVDRMTSAPTDRLELRFGF